MSSKDRSQGRPYWDSPVSEVVLLLSPFVCEHHPKTLVRQELSQVRANTLISVTYHFHPYLKK